MGIGMKMTKNWKKSITKCGAAMMAAALMMTPLTAQAWELNGNSTQENEIEGEIVSPDTTIETNYHAGGITGFVVVTPYKTVNSILGISDEAYEKGDHGVIYIADTSCGELAKAAFEQEAGKVQGTILRYFDIQMFAYVGEYNHPQNQLSSPIRMTVGLEKGDRSSDYKYAMIRLHDGVTTLLPDLDDDAWTVTFESDKFSTYGLIKYPKDVQVAGAPANITEVMQGTSAGSGSSTDSDLDEVPKTGETDYAGMLIIAGMVFVAVAAGYKARKSRV